MGLRQQKRQHLIQSILDTTCELIEEVGYEATQVEEITRRLDSGDDLLDTVPVARLRGAHEVVVRHA